MPLGGALEPLFDARPGDDRRSIAESEPRPQGAVFVPKSVELSVESLELAGEIGIVGFGEPMPNPRSSFARLVDSVVDL